MNKAGFNEEMALNRYHVYKEGVQFMRSGAEITGVKRHNVVNYSLIPQG